MDEKTREEVDDAMRVLAVGEAVLDAAERDPALRAWLDQLLDAELTNPYDRELFGLSKNPPPKSPTT